MDGEEDVRRDRPDRGLRALVGRALPSRDRCQFGIDRKTVRKYLEPVEAAGIIPGGPPAMAAADWAPLIARWFPQVADAGLRQVTWPQIGVHRDWIRGQL
jgi:hypothetical protein